MVIAQPIGQQVTFRVGGGPASSGFPASLMGNIAYVRQLYLDLDHYKQAKESRRPEYDHALEGLAESPRVLLPAEEAQQIDRMLNFAPELKTPVLLYGLHEAYRRIETLKQTHVPLLVSLKWPEKPRDAGPERRAELSRTAHARAGAHGARAVGQGRAEIRVLFGWNRHRGRAAAGREKGHRCGVAEGRCDSCADPERGGDVRSLAIALGRSSAGKIANLVVTKGDVFEDKTTIEYVFVDGRKFEPEKEVHD